MGILDVFKSKIKFSASQEESISRMSNKEKLIIFLTGRAGTGKSTIVKEYIARRSKEGIKVCVLGSTGLAALNIGGSTIHSFFRFKEDAFEKDFSKPFNKEGFNSFDELIIDEISMVRVDLMNAILNSLQNSDGSDGSLTGGKRLILVGDLAQLPPVVDSKKEFTARVLSQYNGIYFYHALYGQKSIVEKIELSEVFRQNEGFFKEMLNDFRMGEPPRVIIDKMNELVTNNADESIITLCPTRAKVEEINQSRLKSLKGEEVVLRGSLKDSFTHSFPSPMNLCLKEGSRIMFTANSKASSDSDYVNGEMGVIAPGGLKKKSDSIGSYIVVKKDNGDKVRVYHHKWEQLNYKSSDKGGFERVVTGTYKQYPVKLGWSVTIHKSQGLSFDKVHIDLGKGCFTHGQLYVALSRCRSYEGVSLARKILVSDAIFDSELSKVIS